MTLSTRDKFSNPSEVFIPNNDWSARVASQEKKLPTTQYGNYTCLITRVQLAPIALHIGV